MSLARNCALLECYWETSNRAINDSIVLRKGLKRIMFNVVNQSQCSQTENTVWDKHQQRKALISRVGKSSCTLLLKKLMSIRHAGIAKLKTDRQSSVLIRQ